MKKIRLFHFGLLFVLFALLTFPMLLLYSHNFLPLAIVALLCAALAFLLEESITFHLMRYLDQMQWVNRMGGPTEIGRAHV